MMDDTRFEQLRTALQTESDRRIDVHQAWDRFQRRRPQASRQRRRLMAAVATAAVVIAVSVSAAVVRLDGGVSSHSGGTGPAAVTPARAAVAARIPVADVTSMTADGTDVWALTGSDELIRIDARTNAVTLRAHVAGVANGSPVVAGGGAVWLDGAGPAGHARLLKIDPATGAISAQTTLPAGCDQAAYGLDHVWVLCNAASTVKVLRVDPATGQVDAQTGGLPGGPAITFVAGSEGVWLGTNAGLLQVDPSGTQLTGLKVTGSPKYLSIYSADYIGSLAVMELALGDGAVWALNGNVSGQPEHLAEINPATGRITVAFAYPEVADTSNDFWDLNAAFGQGSIWMLAPLGSNEIVRISTTSGNPVSRVYPGGSCSQYCSQVYDIAGAVWEPTAQQIIRINPAAMPG
jgi:outer membrane protein assembly factor BamB